MAFFLFGLLLSLLWLVRIRSFKLRVRGNQVAFAVNIIDGVALDFEVVSHAPEEVVAHQLDKALWIALEQLMAGSLKDVQL